MKNYLILTILCSLLMSYTSFGQASGCGTIPTPEEMEYLNQTEDLRQAFSYDIEDREPIQIPIANHIIRRSNGTDGLTTQELATAIQGLNDFYAQANIQFFECESVEFIDNDNWYNFNYNDDASVYTTYNVDGALNFYYFNSIFLPGLGGLCGYANFPSNNPRDRIMMANGCTTSGTTLIHEVGHYFSLYHTHGTSNCGSVTDELVNGSNCNTAGDRLCDTPADPNLRQGSSCQTSLVNSSCQYTGNLTDANGQSYNPQTNNIMSYSRSSCRTLFTQGQFDRLVFSAMNDRDYLSCASCTDNDNDGICQEDDCNDNDANFPKPQGTACNDNNSNTTNDMIQADGCTCLGTSIPNDNPCEAIQISVSNGNVIITNITSSTMTLQIIGEGTGWTNQPICSGSSCGGSQTVSGLEDGDYTVKAFNSYPGCYASHDVEIDDTDCVVDNDNDGVCQQDDCNDNDANFPKPQGTPCDDGDASTSNDVIQSDGCTCAGTSTPDNPCIGLTVSGGSNGAVTIVGAIPSLRLEINGPQTNWTDLPICDGDCNNPQVVNNLSEGTYTVKASHSNPGCYASYTVPVTGGGTCGIDLVSFTRTDGAANCDEYELTIGISQNEAGTIQITNLPANGYAGSTPGVGSIGWLSQTSFTWNIPANSNGLHTATLEYCWAAEANAQATFNGSDCNETISVNQGGGASVITLSDTDVTLSPNPAKHETYLNMHSLAGLRGTLSISNMLGQTVERMSFSEIPNAPILIQTNDYANGLYFIDIHTEDNQRVVKKLLINKQ